MRYAIIGSRNFADYELLKSVLDKHFISQIISGGARGADSLAARYAKESSISLLEFIPEWDKYGKTAGFIRNKDIVRASDIIIAFWDGESRGTKHSLDFASSLGKRCIVISSKPCNKNEKDDLWEILN